MIKMMIALRGGTAAVLTIWAAQAIAATGTVPATATAVSPLAVSVTTPFNFGSIVPGATAGTVVLSTASGRTPSGGTTLGNGTTPTAAVVHLAGSGTSTFAATFSAGTTLSDGAAHTMTVGSYIMKVTGGADQSSGYTGALVAGAQDFDIGATLTVDTATNNPAGTYTTALAGGTPLTVTVVYN